MNRHLLHALSIAPLLFLLLFFCYPLAEIARLSFIPSAVSGGRGVFSVFMAEEIGYTAKVIGFSLWQASLSTLFTLAAGLPVAYFFARKPSPFKRWVMALVTVPFVMPTVVVAAAFNALLGPRGLINEALRALQQEPLVLINSLGIIVLAHVFYNFSVVVRLVSSFWAALGQGLDESAAALGANRWQTFWHVTLPVAAPAIGAAAALTFLFCFTSFGVIVLLGGPSFATLETEIYRQTSQVLRLDVAASLAFTQLLITLALGWFSNSLQRRASTALDLQPRSTTTPPINPKTKPTAREVAAQFFLVVLITLLILAPLGALVLRSLNLDDAQGPLHFYASLGENSRGSAFFVAPLVAVRNSLAFACTTAIVAVLMGIPLAYELGNKATRTTRLLELLLLLPLGTSAITLGLGLFIAFDFPIDLRASPLMLPLAHTLLALPFVVRALLPATRAIGPTLREAAAQLGATPLQVLRFIDLPLIAKPVLAAAAFAFAISLGEFGASLLVSRPEFPTMPIVIANLLGRPGALNYGQAMAMCTLLMLVTMTSVALSDAP